MLFSKLLHYAQLMRMHKPIGFFLVLWPTLWALWLANQGQPALHILFIFTAGAFLMRSAGCVMNDIIDRKFDGQVARTAQRPLVSGKLKVNEALCLAVFLSAGAFLLVLQCNRLTIQLAVVGMVIAILYPFLKRLTFLPQLGLGAAFSWGIPMAFAAQRGEVSAAAWCLFATALVWPIIYDTFYAMVDQEDDIKIGVKSTAILFASHTASIIAGLQTLFIAMLLLVGYLFHLNYFYDLSVLAAALLFVYQQRLIKSKNKTEYFRAFLNNNVVGLVLWIGILLGLES